MGRCDFLAPALTTPMPNEAPLDVRLHVPARCLISYCRLLQYGVALRVPAETRVVEVLRDVLRLDEQDLDFVQTVFLDCSPLDDLERARLRPGSVLAISAALPGLVGAVMRRSGALARLRESINLREASEPSNPATSEQIELTLKLFNLLQERLGPRLLAQGVSTSATRLAAFLESLAPGVLSQASAMFLNGSATDPAALIAALSGAQQPALLRVLPDAA